MARRLVLASLGLIVAMVSVVALAANAQAVTHEVVFPEGDPTGVLTGENEAGTVDKFTFSTILGAMNVECPEAIFETTVANQATEATIHPTYPACGGGAAVRTNHCAYIFKRGETSINGHAPVTVECENEGQANESVIEVDIPGICKLTIGAQHELTSGVHYSNVLGPGHVTVKATVGNIKIKGKDAPTVGENNCAVIGGNAGTYTGTETVKAWQDLGNAGTATTPQFTEGWPITVEVKPG